MRARTPSPREAAPTRGRLSPGTSVVRGRGPGYWKPRLLAREYSMQARLKPGRELSAHIGHEGAHSFFPLGTHSPARAAQRASQIYGIVVRRGWEKALELFPREVTVAVFWGWSPIACTYATFQTLPPGSEPEEEAPVARGLRVLVVEPEPALRRTLRFWLARQSGFSASVCAVAPGEAQRLPADVRADVVFANRELLALGGRGGTGLLPKHLRSAPVFYFGVHEESNYIFHCVSGVAAGYFLRRRPPDSLVEPLAALARDGSMTGEALSRGLTRYFRRLFDAAPSPQFDHGLGHLTAREQQILVCLSQGCTDKEIAQALSISKWTVHGHVKRVFEKLQAHSRAEAVAKFLRE